MATVPTWGYRRGESRIFELPANDPVLPDGWYDSPAGVPADDGPGADGGAQAAGSSPAPAAPPLPSIDEQERAEYRRALAENEALKAENASLARDNDALRHSRSELEAENGKVKARVTELERELAGAAPVASDGPSTGDPPPETKAGKRR